MGKGLVGVGGNVTASGVKPITLNNQPSNPTGSTSQGAANSAQVVPSVSPAPPFQSINPANREELLNYSSYNPASGKPDPRDDQYWANLSRLISSKQVDYAGEMRGGELDEADYNYRLARESEGNRQNVRDTAENLIGTGLLRSGAHNRQQTEMGTEYGDLLAGLGSDMTRSRTNRESQKHAILAALGLEEGDLYEESVGRYATAQQKAAESGAAIAEGSGAVTDTGGGKNKNKLTASKSKRTGRRGRAADGGLQAVPDLSARIKRTRTQLANAQGDERRVLEARLTRLRNKRNRRQRNR